MAAISLSLKAAPVVLDDGTNSLGGMGFGLGEQQGGQ
jgi:hypothetical protein